MKVGIFLSLCVCVSVCVRVLCVCECVCELTSLFSITARSRPCAPTHTHTYTHADAHLQSCVQTALTQSRSVVATGTQPTGHMRCMRACSCVCVCVCVCVSLTAHIWGPYLHAQKQTTRRHDDNTQPTHTVSPLELAERQHDDNT